MIKLANSWLVKAARFHNSNFREPSVEKVNFILIVTIKVHGTRCDVHLHPFRMCINKDQIHLTKEWTNIIYVNSTAGSFRLFPGMQ